MKPMNPDELLLRRYVDTRDQTAFAELVDKYLPLVYRTAHRQLSGDQGRAEEVAQSVFTLLARRAASVAGHPVLAAWLHTSTRNVATRLLRNEQLRQQRHVEAGRMNEIEQSGEAEVRWEQLQPVIDEALAELREKDREAVLQRFFEEKTYAEVGAQLGLSEDAARMRVDRALEKLRRQLMRRGIDSASVALSLALTGHGALAVPAGLAASVTQASLAAAGAGGAGVLAGWLASGSAKMVALGGVGLAVIVASVWLGSDAEINAVTAGDGIKQETQMAAKADPVAALLEKWDWVSSEEQARLLAALSAEDIGQLLRRLWEENTEQSRRRFHEIFDQWCESVPEAAAKWSVAMWDVITGEDGAKLREQSGLAWSAVDLDNAFAWALGLRDAKDEAGLAVEMLGRLAKTDPHRAIAMAKEESGGFYEVARLAILEGWFELNPSAAFESLGDECIRFARFSSLLVHWMETDPVAALAWGIQSVTRDDPRYKMLSRRYLVVVGSAFSLKDPASFIGALWVSNLDEGKYRVMTMALESFFANDSKRAMQWVEDLPESSEKQKLISDWGMCIFKGSAGYKTQLLALQLTGESRKELNGNLRQWVLDDPEAAMSWVLKEGDPQLLNIAYVSSLNPLAALSPEKALKEFSSMPASVNRDMASVALASGWSETDSTAAIDWLFSFDQEWATRSREDFETQDAVGYLVGKWAQTDVESMLDWAANSSQPEQAYGAVVRAASYLGQFTQPDTAGSLKALTLLEQVPDSMADQARVTGKSICRIQLNPASKDQAIIEYVKHSSLFTAEDKAELLDEGSK